MKKIAVLALVTLFLVSCKKEEKTVDIVAEPTGLQIILDSTQVNWTAYKTTDKVGVNGKFIQLELKNTQSGETPETVLEGASFSIPVSSIFTDNPDRDGKIKQFFFGVLKNTEMIGGTFNFRDGKCFMTLTLNDVTKQLEVTHSINNKKFMVKHTLNLEDFGALDAVTSINEACYDLHKGPDGVSKTWSEVEISGSVLFE
jgi:hypothetical protein